MARGWRRAALLGLLIADAAHMSALAADGEAGARETRPVRMEVHRSAGKILLLVIGSADTPMRVRYALDVSGASTTRHRGTTVLQRGPSVMSRVEMDAGKDWTARLEVSSAGGATYVVTESARR